MTPEQLNLSSALDINYWYARYKEKCPNCGMNFTNVHPMYNLFPHFMGACKQSKQAA